MSNRFLNLLKYFGSAEELWTKLQEDVLYPNDVSEFFSDGLIELFRLRPGGEYHEDYGPVLWYRVENGKLAGEAPWVGSPLWEEWAEDDDGVPYYTHWTMLPPFPPDPITST